MSTAHTLGPPASLYNPTLVRFDVDNVDAAELTVLLPLGGGGVDTRATMSMVGQHACGWSKDLFGKQQTIRER